MCRQLDQKDCLCLEICEAIVRASYSTKNLRQHQQLVRQRVFVVQARKG